MSNQGVNLGLGVVMTTWVVIARVVIGHRCSIKFYLNFTMYVVNLEYKMLIFFFKLA